MNELEVVIKTAMIYEKVTICLKKKFFTRSNLTISANQMFIRNLENSFWSIKYKIIWIYQASINFYIICFLGSKQTFQILQS